MKSKQRTIMVLILTVFIVGTLAVPCMAQTRSVALLDLAAPSTAGSPDSQTFSLEHALNVAGIPFVKYNLETVGLSGALRHIMVVASHRIYGSTFSESERTELEQYVSAGGILVLQRVGTTTLYGLFGISDSQSLDTRYTMTWNTISGDSSLRWFDDPLEQTISLAADTSPINTVDYVMAGASPLAHYDDDTVAVVKHAYGNGYAYAVGFSWKDLILRNQLAIGGASRSYSNGFEPTSDTVFLFLRGIYESLVPFAAWKHTSPYYSQSTLMITHDADSRTSMEMIAEFAAMELSKGAVTTYNITTHYLRDDRLSDFYNPYVNEIIAVLALNQKVGTHSVGHFPDFNNETIVPIGAPGNNTTNYRPMWSEALGQAVGATVYGELEVPRDLLMNDAGVQDVTIYRSGHLAWNKVQIDVLQALGYKYDTTRSANNVLTNFPYRCRFNTSYSGDISNIYEIPMTISDVDYDETNYAGAMRAMWTENTLKNTANHAPTVLLVHPNRDWKITEQAAFMDAIPGWGMIIADMETYGDYWRARESFSYETEVSNNTLTILIPDSQIPLDEKLSIVVDDGKSLTDILVRTVGGLSVPHRQIDWNGNSVVVSFTTMRGDFNGDWQTDLNDLVVCLQVLAGLSPAGVNRFESVNADSKIRPNDAVFLLQTLAGLRIP